MQVQAHQFPSSPSLDPAAFRKRGYVVVKHLFEDDEVKQLRSVVIETFAEMQQDGHVGIDPGREGTIRGLDRDLLSVPSLRHVLLESRILRVIGELLGGAPVYFGDSSVRIGGNGVRAWHRDNVNRARRRGPDWDDSYRLIRCGLYLQDHSRHSGGLALRPHSHETKRLLPTFPTLAGSEAGNLVAWNMRTVHSGEVVRMRGLSGVPLNPRVQSRLPDRMRVPEDRERVVLFMAFGLSGSHLDNYVEYLKTRHYMQKSWSRSRFGPEVWDEAKSAGLHVLRPIPTYGTPPDRTRLDPDPPTEHRDTTPADLRATQSNVAECGGDSHDSGARSREPLTSDVTPQSVRLIVVYQATHTRGSGWLPPSRRGDVVVTLDPMACADLTDRSPLLFDELESWEERDVAEHRIVNVLAAIREHPAVAEIAHTGYSLIDFVGPRLRPEIVRLLRGWTLARVAPNAHDLVCDPATPPALLMGVRAGLGLDPAAVPFAIPPATPGLRLRRAAARQIMRGFAAISRPEQVRVAAVATGKLSLALASLSATDLHTTGVGVLPFPGLDYGDGTQLAFRRRLPLLTAYGPRRPGPGVAVNLPERLDLGCEPELNRALTVLVEKLLTSSAAEQDQAIRALGGLTRTHSLRAIMLPGVTHCASRLLIAYARDRGLRVGTLQHDIYGFRESDSGDKLADVLFAWGEGTAEQTRHWPDPRPAIAQVGVPGLIKTANRSPVSTLGNALIATGQTVDTPITPIALREKFVEVLAPGLARLAAAGVKLKLRPHPDEDPERYRQLLARYGLDIPIIAGGSFQAATANADIVVSLVSSVALEAGTLGLPVLLWLGPAPRWVRKEHFVAPWTESTPGTFEGSEDFRSLVDDLLERPADGLRVAHALGRRLTRYAQPFNAASFAETLRALAA
jgi:hypothetical protein